MKKNSGRLYLLYKEGKLESPLSFLRKRDYRLLGYGTQVYAYSKNGGRYVLKLCPNSINIMKHKQINSLGTIKNINNYFAKIINIVYKDDNVFIYKQRLCKRFRLHNNNNIKKICEFIIKLTIFMIKNNTLVSDLGTHNMGIYKNRYLIFDYHTIYNLETVNKVKLIKNINKFINVINLHIDNIELQTLYDVLKVILS